MPKKRSGNDNSPLAKNPLSGPVTRQKLKTSTEASQEKKKETVAFCATRTVEWQSTHETGKNKHKLLFALTLGLIPKYDGLVEPALNAKVEKMKPDLEAKAKAVTEKRIKALLRRKNLKSKAAIPKTPTQHRHRSRRRRRPVKINLENVILVPLYLIPDDDGPHVSPDNCELIDLVSDDEDNGSNGAPSLSYKFNEPSDSQRSEQHADESFVGEEHSENCLILPEEQVNHLTDCMNDCSPFLQTEPNRPSPSTPISNGASPSAGLSTQMMTLKI